MIYPVNFEEKTGFNRIREIVKTYCQYEPGRKTIDSLSFCVSLDETISRISMVEEFRQVIIAGTDFPVEHFVDMSASLGKAAVEGNWIEENEVADLRKSLDTVRNVISFFRKDEDNRYPTLKELAKDVRYFPVVIDRINKILKKNGRIRDNATPALNHIRQGILSLQSQISGKLQRLLKAAQSQGWIDEDSALAVRNGRTVIPVAATHKRKIKGYVHDESSTGKTVYIEPAEIVEANNELRELENEERREIIRVLIDFSNFIRPYIPELTSIHHFFAVLDSVIARARFALKLNALKPEIIPRPFIKWRKAVHPLLLLSFREAGKEREVIPLDIDLDNKQRILLISGPNAGGKSVCLQTVGLLQYMLQCGFLVPVTEGSVFGIFERIFIDIGDEQSIESDLSTYSSHLINMKFFLKNAGDKTLVLIDEFGTGTEPLLGGAIAESVLEKMNNNNCYGIITTHYTNLKHFAASAEGIVNGAMLFDNHKMQALFKLDIGQPGSSFAFEIARKIGLPEDVLLKAQESAGKDHIDFDKHLRDILRDKKYWENKRQQIRISEKKLTELVEKYDLELRDTEKIKKKILGDAKQKAEEMLTGANRQIENTIREIREAEADKIKTREARKKLETFKENIVKPDPEQKDNIQRKIEELQISSEKHGIRSHIRKHPTPVEEPVEKNIRIGSYVVLRGTNNAGEVISLTGRKCTIAFGSMKTLVDTDQLEIITSGQYKQLTRRTTGPPSEEFYNAGLKKLFFKPEIDLRGKRGEEALTLVAEFIDQAIIVQARELRILHGKGNGILREMIRQYLNTIDVIEWFGDAHIEAGGAGITVVKMEI